MSYVVYNHKNKREVILHLFEMENFGTERELPDMSGSIEKCLNSKEASLAEDLAKIMYDVFPASALNCQEALSMSFIISHPFSS